MEALSRAQRAQIDTPVADSGAPSDHSDWTTPAPPARGVPMTPAELEKLESANGRSGVVILPPAVLSTLGPNAPRPPADSIGRSTSSESEDSEPAPSGTDDSGAPDDSEPASSGTDGAGAPAPIESNDSNGKSATSETNETSAKTGPSASNGEGK